MSSFHQILTLIGDSAFYRHQQNIRFWNEFKKNGFSVVQSLENNRVNSKV